MTEVLILLAGFIAGILLTRRGILNYEKERKTSYFFIMGGIILFLGGLVHFLMQVLNLSIGFTAGFVVVVAVISTRNIRLWLDHFIESKHRKLDYLENELF